MKPNSGSTPSSKPPPILERVSRLEKGFAAGKKTTSAERASPYRGISESRTPTLSQIRGASQTPAPLRSNLPHLRHAPRGAQRPNFLTQKALSSPLSSNMTAPRDETASFGDPELSGRAPRAWGSQKGSSSCSSEYSSLEYNMKRVRENFLVNWGLKPLVSGFSLALGMSAGYGFFDFLIKYKQNMG